MTRTHKIAVIAGDGIGTEVVPAALRVLARAGELFDYQLDLVELPWSCAFYATHGAMMDEDGLEQLAATDAIFLGAVGSPEVPDPVSLWGLLIPIRRAFHQYVNLRPVRLLAGVEGPLRPAIAAEGIDLVIVRENNEGEYSEIGGRLNRHSADEIAVQESVFTRRGVERVARFAFETARGRRSRVMSATKSNGIIHTLPFWDEILEEVATDYPDVVFDKMHVDALAAQFVLHPSRLDVVVGSNLFGDILSDLGAAVAGSIGIAPSANLNPTKEFPSMFEPVHGSAPDIAGKGIANPIGQIWSGAMMLRHLGEHAAADAVEGAFASVLASGGVRTADLGGKSSTVAVTDAIVEALGARPS